MSDTPNIGIPYVPEGTLDPAAGLNLALNVLDALVQSAVLSMSETSPPVSPADGDLYIVGTGATGAWSGQDDNLARYVSEGAFWQFYVAGAQVFYVLNLEDGGLYRFDGSAGWNLAAGLGDAPNDGVIYARKNAGWVAAWPAVVTESGANLDATPSNAGNYTRFTHAAPTYTFDDAESYVVGAEYKGRYEGAGTLTILPTSGMTINPPYGGTLGIPPGGTFTVKIVASSEADLIGVTVPES